MAARTATTTDSGLAARLAALASLGAAVIHLAVVPSHWHEWIPAGLFFVALALFQLGWAGLILTRRTTPVLTAGITVNIGAVVLWALSRTAGPPFGPHAGVAEVVAAADLCALLLQIYVVMGAGWVRYRGHRGDLIPLYANAVVLLGAATVVALASTVGVASGLRHSHHAPAGAEPGHHGSGHTDDHAEDHQGHHAEPATPPRTVDPVGTPAPLKPRDAPVVPAQPAHDGHADHTHDHAE